MNFREFQKYFMALGCQNLPEIPKNMITYPCFVDVSQVYEACTALDDNGEIAGCVLKLKNGNSIWVSNSFEDVKEILTEFFSNKNQFNLN